MDEAGRETGQRNKKKKGGVKKKKREQSSAANVLQGFRIRVTGALS